MRRRRQTTVLATRPSETEYSSIQFENKTKGVSLLFFSASHFSAASEGIGSVCEENIAQMNVFGQQERRRRFSIGDFFFLFVQFDSSKETFFALKHVVPDFNIRQIIITDRVEGKVCM
jgi:hypothetical protein